MNICFLLESTELSGGVRVVFDQAYLLMQRGHKVTIRARFGNHHWYHHTIDINYIDNLAQPFFADTVPDVVIATFWTTAQAALQLHCPRVFHFCQGYEGDFPEYASLREQIEQAYRLPIPKLTVGDWLTTRLQQIYGNSSFTVQTIGQLVDTALFTPPSFAYKQLLRKLFRRPAKILLIGLFESSVKGIPDALHAISLLRRKDVRLYVTRISNRALSDKEKEITPIDCYLSKLSPQAMARLYRAHDFLIAPSHAAEGFGLPFAEALASGVACVATAIPSHLSFDETHDYAAFVPPSDPKAIAHAMRTLLNSPDQQMYLRKRGPQLMQKLFAANAAAERLEQICLKSFDQ
ncbi:Glycosyltransferase involved in cell wall bisynthesis [Nitrosomonas aestuarii]|uniref:Glycosyltransferase involved in cell wall bisynthesis n=1 Tax=Nitrosomonas aestuarii TaxID=52441 RepID=A0A1I4CFG0_9PROT|nr:glycosyltransferase family 4 protein [Nitrosomonas aestuarii]SFK79340.1 Glycosyltransferase involved in cell wall bisynthesis [Nitrosomonas aestuarii]